MEMLDAVINMQRKCYPIALECINRSIRSRERLGEHKRIADALEYRRDINLNSGDCAEAAWDYQQAHAIYRSIGSEAGIKRTEGKISTFR